MYGPNFSTAGALAVVPHTGQTCAIPGIAEPGLFTYGELAEIAWAGCGLTLLVALLILSRTRSPAQAKPLAHRIRLVNQIAPQKLLQGKTLLAEISSSYPPLRGQHVRRAQHRVGVRFLTIEHQILSRLGAPINRLPAASYMIVAVQLMDDGNERGQVNDRQAFFS